MSTTSTARAEAPAVVPGGGTDDRRRALLAAAGLAALLLERGTPGLPVVDGLAGAVAVEVAARTGLPGDGGTGAVLVATALACREHLLAHPGRVPVPAGLLPGDVFDEDVRGSDALEEELWGDGVPLGELAAVVGTVRRPVRLAGLLVLGAGMSTVVAAEVLGRGADDVAADLRHLGRRWTDRRRLGLDTECPVAPPLPDAVAELAGGGSPGAAVVAGSAIEALAAGAPPLDLDAALATVADRARRRRRGRAVALAGAAAVALVLPGGLWLAGREPAPDRVTAAASPTTLPTTTAAPVVTQPPVPSGTAPVLPSTTVAPSSSTTTTTAPTTTVPVTTTTSAPPANQPMTASLQVLTPTVEAGRTATARLTWSDPDLADADLRVVDIWGDPAVFYAFPSDAAVACDAPGPGGSGTRDLPFRYATPGTYTISVVVTSCDGTGAYGERVQLSGRIEVVAPVVDGAPGRSVVAATTDPALVSESATATFTPEGGGAPMALEPRDPALALNWSGAPGTGSPTVLRLPDGVRGELRLAGGGSCRVGAVDLTTAAPTVVRAVLDQPC